MDNNKRKREHEDILLFIGGIFVFMLAINFDGTRKCGPARRRLAWQYIRDVAVHERQFKTDYRLSPVHFDHLLQILRPSLELNAKIGDLRGSFVKPENQLMITLRYLAGGRYQDIKNHHGIAKTTFYDIIWRVIDAINSAFAASRLLTACRRYLLFTCNLTFRRAV
ncbi:unnamed protein product [Phaeothamnion confervicola]